MKADPAKVAACTSDKKPRWLSRVLNEGLTNLDSGTGFFFWRLAAARRRQASQEVETW